MKQLPKHTAETRNKKLKKLKKDIDKFTQCM